MSRSSPSGATVIDRAGGCQTVSLYARPTKRVTLRTSPHRARPYMRTSGPLARWGYCTTQLDRIRHKATDRVTPTCLMLTTHWRMPPRLSRGLAHVSRGHSITLRCRSPPGRCLSSAPSVSHRLTGGAQHHARKSASSPHFTRKPCMLAQRVHSTAWLNMSPALHASLRVGWPPRCTTRGMAWRLTGDSAEFPCLASRAAGHVHLGRRRI